MKEKIENRNILKAVEFIYIFLALPISYVFDYNPVIKVVLALLGFAYVLVYLWRTKSFNFKTSKHLFRPFFKTLCLRFIIIASILTLYTYFFQRDMFFKVFLNNPKLWLMILFVYSFLSVTFQEMIYRAYFFHRFEPVFKNKNILIFINALVFSLAHIFLKSSFVLFLTFVGGVFFALTYHKTRSTTLVCIEHAVYGFWLFTVGLGEMLAFPGAEANF